MFGRPFWLIALIVFVVGESSRASVTKHADAAGTSPQAPAPRLAVFGHRRLVNGPSITLPKLDGALAEIAERHVNVAAERPLTSLHAVNPAARFRLSAPLATPEVLIDAVTTGDPQALARALEHLGVRDVAVFSNDVGGWLPVDQLPAAAELAELRDAEKRVAHAIECCEELR